MLKGSSGLRGRPNQPSDSLDQPSDFTEPTGKLNQLTRLINRNGRNFQTISIAPVQPIRMSAGSLIASTDSLIVSADSLIGRTGKGLLFYPLRFPPGFCTILIFLE